MFLKILKIEKNGEEIRNIAFHKGLNLIIDETKTEDKKESGNNLGKTTILRLVDFCLGSDGSNIYQDKEFKQRSNTQIEKYLKGNNVLITLVLKDDLDDENSEEIVIKRNFMSRLNKIQEINEKQYSNEEFPKKLKELIFKSTSEKPSIRQIVAKNIRDEKNKLANTVKVLSPYTSQQEYESLYLFWLGIELDANTRKQKLIREKSIELNLQSRLKKDSTLSQIEQSLLVINRTIRELESKKKSLNLSNNYSQDIEKLNTIKFNINKLSTELSRLEFRKSLILESKEDLEKETSNIDESYLKSLYQEAKIVLPQIHKTFSETLKFHNQMVGEKIKFITEEMPELELMSKEILRNIDLLSLEEKQLSNKLQRLGAFEGLEKIIPELTTAYEKKGSFEGLKEVWENSNIKLESIIKELGDIDAGIRSKDLLIQERISEFNKFFADMSNKLYDEQFILSADVTEKGYELNISSISGNLGTGKKKGQIAAFDLGYIQFADSNSIECLHFIMHDQIENVHGNQISLLSEIVSEVNCQYIIPILKDKLPSTLNINQYEVISLSQSNKLFKVQ